MYLKQQGHHHLPGIVGRQRPSFMLGLIVYAILPLSPYGARVVAPQRFLRTKPCVTLHKFAKSKCCAIHAVKVFVASTPPTKLQNLISLSLGSNWMRSAGAERCRINCHDQRQDQRHDQPRHVYRTITFHACDRRRRVGWRWEETVVIAAIGSAAAPVLS